MIVYWLMFLVPALLSLQRVGADRRGTDGALIILFVCLFFIMAFRQTGGDFYTYNLFTELIRGRPLTYVIEQTEVLYGLINFLSVRAGFGIYGVNFICSAIFLIALYKFLRHEPYPMLGLALAAVYFIIVVGIGYTRQGVAIALILWGIVYLREGRTLAYGLFVVVAMGFHTSAALGILLIQFGLKFENKFIKLLATIAILAVGIFGATRLFYDTFSLYIRAYVETERYSSAGAAYRLAMSVAAAGIYLPLRKRLAESDRAIWTGVAIATFAALPLFFVSTTVADRIGLYLIPLQIVVFGRLPALFPARALRSLVTLLILLGFGGALAIWIFLGSFAKVLWLPYSNLLFGTFA